MFHVQFLGKPRLVVGNGLKFGSAQCHHSQSFGRWCLVYDVDAQFLQSVLEGVEQGVGLVDVVNVESEESRRACGFVAASLSAEGSLPTHGWQVALQVEVARSYLVAEGFQMWLSDDLLECLARQRDGELVTIWAIVDVHLFVCV